MLENYPNNIEPRVHLIFIQTVCSSTFGEYFSSFISNRVFDENEFASLFATELEKYMSFHSQNNFFKNFISKLFFFKKNDKSVNKNVTSRRGSPHPQTGGKKILEKGSVTPKEMDLKISIEKKLMSGEYESLNEMARDINGGTPSKEIEQVIFKNMMKIMLKEFNC